MCTDLTAGVSDVQLWIIQLWVWADKFDISEEDLPRNREGLLAITDLDIRSKQLIELPESIGQLTKLRRLVVSKNQLDRLPDSIGKLINLECLDISNNPLATLPESIIQLKELDFITIAEDGATNKLVDLSAEVTDFLRGLSHGCKGWSDTIKPIRSTSIQEYLLRQQRLNRNTVVDEDTDHIPLESIDREALQEVIKWAELCDLPSHAISRDPDELVNQTSLSIDSYTQPIPKAIGCLTQLRNLALNSCMSSGSDARKAVDSLPNIIADLVNLEKLSLVCKSLAFLPANLHELKNLKTLEITFHDVITIPKVLAEMSCDIKLHLYSNQHKLPDNLLAELANIRYLTELSINDEHLTILPDNISQLKNLKALNITSCSLKEIPKTIGALAHLTHLTLNCEALEHLPESVGQLSELEELIVISEKIEQLPESLVNLTRLRGLNISAHLVDNLPISIIERYRDNELWLRNVPLTTLYTPSTDEYSLSEFGFFVIEDGWNKESLVDLKYKTGACFLFGLQTTEKSIDELDMIDGVIVCQPDEVQQVVSIYESIILLSRTSFCLDLNDLKIPLWYTRPAKFIHTNVIGKSESDCLERAANNMISQISKGLSIDYMIFSFESDRELSIDEYSRVATIVEDRVMDNAKVFYDLRYVDKIECYWMGAIYVAS